MNEHYCLVCGNINSKQAFLNDASYTEKDACILCGNKNYDQIPGEYQISEETMFNNKSLYSSEKQRFLQEIVFTNPHFNKELYNQRDQLQKEFWDRQDRSPEQKQLKLDLLKDDEKRYDNATGGRRAILDLQYQKNPPEWYKSKPAYLIQQNSSQYQPKCPTCSSPNVQKIGVGEKVLGGTLFGIFSSKIRKSYKCKNCKHMW